MKLKRKLFSSMAFVLSLVMLAVSGAIFVHSAQQQTATSSLSVTFSGENVNYEVQGWYQVKNNATRHSLKNGNNTTLSFSATDPSSTQTLEVVENNGSVPLSATDTYVLFTYKFANTASNGAFGMLVSLTGSTPNDSNIRVNYLVSDADATDYFPTGNNVTAENIISALDDQKDNVYASSATAFSDVFVQAGHYKYFYILVSLIDNTLNGTYNNTVSWTVRYSTDIEEQDLVSITFNRNNKNISTAVVFFDDGIAVYKATGSGEDDPFYVQRGSTISVRSGSNYVNVNLGDNINSIQTVGVSSSEFENNVSGVPTYIFRIGGTPHPGNFDFVADAGYIVWLLCDV